MKDPWKGRVRYMCMFDLKRNQQYWSRSQAVLGLTSYLAPGKKEGKGGTPLEGALERVGLAPPYSQGLWLFAEILFAKTTVFLKLPLQFR